MNGKDLLISLGYISSAFFEEAETAVLCTPPLSHRKSLRRPLLIAAIITVTLLLVGCAVAYALRLQDMSVGQETYTQHFDKSGKYLEEPIEKTKDIIIFSGSSGQAYQQALLEWIDFLESYDPDGELMTNDPALPHIPDRYEYTYSCYTQEMVDKVDELAEKYSLKLLDTWIPFQRYQSHIFLEETGIGSLLLPDVPAEIKGMAGMLYPPYNFHMEFSLVTEKDPNGLLTSITYNRKDYFPRAFMGSSIDLSTIEQWDHTTRDGTQVLLALSSKGQGYIIAESDAGMLIIQIDGNRTHSDYPDKTQIISPSELEAFADLFDYDMDPKAIDRTVIEARLSETEEAYHAEHAYVPEVYESFNDYLMNQVHHVSSNHQYTFHDLNGDGAEELVLGHNGAITECLTRENGDIVSKMFGGFYLCEGNVLEVGYVYEGYYDYEEHFFQTPAEDSGVFSADWKNPGKSLDSLVRKQDQWYRVTEESYQFVYTPVSREEAEAILAKYPRMELDWKPVAEYPLDSNGYTLGDHLAEKDVRVSDEELFALYKEYLATQADDFYTHYRIVDINGDGVDDLLLSGNGEFFWYAVTYRYGVLNSILVSDFLLCENNVLMEKTLDRQDGGVEVEIWHFLRLNGFTQESLAQIAYNKATASWQSDYYGTPLEEYEAEKILAQYPPLDQNMGLISELLD